MASLGSYTRSAARATFYAYRRLPIRWRLAGGSAALTFVILAGFAAIVGVLTTRQVRGQFDNQVRTQTDELSAQLQVPGALVWNALTLDCNLRVHLSDIASLEHAQIRIFDQGTGELLCTQNPNVTGSKAAQVTPNFTPPQAV